MVRGIEFELEVRPRVLESVRSGFPSWATRLGPDHIVDLSVLGQLSETSLTRDVEIVVPDNGLPNTFIPGRNLLFLTFAATVAYRHQIKHIVTGVCETDYSGYPDCRDDTIKALQLAVNLGMEARFVIHTPLMWMDKAQTWALASQLGGEVLIELLRNQTHTCYNGDRLHRHAWGFGCGICPACELRAAGWERFRSSNFAAVL